MLFIFTISAAYALPSGPNDFSENKLDLVQKCFGCAKTFHQIPAESAPAKIVSKASAPQKTIKVLVKVDENGSLDGAMGKISELGGKINYATEIGNIVFAEIPEKTQTTIVTTRGIESVSSDLEFEIHDADTNQYSNPNQEEFAEYTGKGVRVAVVDTGINSSNLSLLNKIVAQKDFSGENTTEDLHGHGTHVAGIISATTAMGGKVSGVAPNSLLINAKALNANGRGRVSGIIAAISYAINPDNDSTTDDGARIINLSLGIPSTTTVPALEAAIKQAQELGVIVIVSAGNCGYEAPSASCNGYTGLTFPGSMKEPITVGAIDANGNLAGFSSRGFIDGYGPKPDIVSNGTQVFSTWKNNEYKTESGTSQSAAHISGIAALMIEKNPGLMPEDAKRILEESAKDLGLAGRDELYGYGLATPKLALRATDSDLKIVSFTANQTSTTIGTEDPPFSRKLRVFNNTNQKLTLRGYNAQEWLGATYPLEILPHSTGEVTLFADQVKLGVGEHSSNISFAVNNYTLSHKIVLNVVSGKTVQSGDEEFEIEISIPTSIAIEGVSREGRVGKGKTLTINTQFVNTNRTTSGNYFASLKITGPNNYTCYTAPQGYYQPPNGGKLVYFNYTIPLNAIEGSYGVTSYNWTSCTGVQDDGKCHLQSEFSCEFSGNWTHEFLKNNAFNVTPACTEGACCNLASQTLKPSGEVCSENMQAKYSCNKKKGGTLSVQYLSQTCSGTSSICNGSQNWGTTQAIQYCTQGEICDETAGKCLPDPVRCYEDYDCGLNGWTSRPTCQGDNIMQEYTAYTCENKGTTQSTCTQNRETRNKNTCAGNNQICSDGTCVTRGYDECTAEQSGKSWCNNFGQIETCNYAQGTYNYKKSFESCTTGICTTTGPQAFCDNSQKQFSIEIDDSPKGITVYKSPNDNFMVNLKTSLESIPVTISYDVNAFETSDATCLDGKTKNLVKGDNYCEYTVKNGATRKPYGYTILKEGIIASRTINIALPLTVIITDSQALKNRYSTEAQKVPGLMAKMYLRAFENQGIVYDLSKYREEIGTPRPWNNFSEYNETLSNPTIDKVNDYALAVSRFVKSRCLAEYCKHVLIVGDDFVVPMGRSIVEGDKNSIVINDKIYEQGTNPGFSDLAKSFERQMKVAIIVPDSTLQDSELRNVIELLKKDVSKYYDTFAVEEYKSSEIKCDSSEGKLANKNLIIIGTMANNRLVGCLRVFQDGLSNYSIRVNPWNGIYATRNFAVILKQDSLSVPQDALIRFEQDIRSKRKYENNAVDMLAACMSLKDPQNADEMITSTTCNVIPIVELVPDAVDSGKCLLNTQKTAADEFVCTVIHGASAYDIVQYATVILSVGTAEAPTEGADIGIATIKNVLKSAAKELPDEILKPAAKTFAANATSILDLIKLILKEGTNALTTGKEMTKAWITILGQGAETYKTTFKILEDFGSLPSKQMESLSRAIKGLGAENWTQMEKKGLHRLIGGYPEGQGDLVITSMKNSGTWNDEFVKKAIELGEDGSKLKNFTKEPPIGGKRPDAKFVIDGKEFIIESTRVSDKVTKEGNLDNFIKIRIDDKYSQLSPSEFSDKDNTIVVGLVNGIDEKLTMQEIRNSLENVINQNSKTYQNLSRVLIKNEITEEIIAVVK